MRLRSYQQTAIELATKDIFEYGHRGKNGGISIDLCTGAGKTLIDLSLVLEILKRDPQANIIVMTTSIELVEQIYHTFKKHGNFQKHQLGLFAGNKKQVKQITIGTVQSLANSADKFKNYDALLFDESHRGLPNFNEINRRARGIARKITNNFELRQELIDKYGVAEGLDFEQIVEHLEDELQGQARKIIKTILANNAYLITVFLSGSQWRYGQKTMIGTVEECRAGLFLISKSSFKITSKELLEQGFLKPIYTKEPSQSLDLSKIRQNAFGYDQYELSEKMSAVELIERHLDEYADVAVGMVEKYPLGQHLVFCVDVRHIEEMTKAFNNHPVLNQCGIKARALHHKIQKEERADIIRGFRNGEFRTIVSGDIISTGFDMANMDATLNPMGYEINLVLGCSPSKSLAKIVQRELGRSCRPRYQRNGKHDLNTVEGRLASIAEGGVPYSVYISFDGHPSLFRQLDGLPLGNPEIGKNRDAPLKRCPVCDAQVPIKALACNTKIFARMHRKDKPDEFLEEGSTCSYQFPEMPRMAFKEADIFEGDIHNSNLPEPEEKKAPQYTHAFISKNGTNIGKPQAKPVFHLRTTKKGRIYLRVELLCTHLRKGLAKVYLHVWSNFEVPLYWRMLAIDHRVANPKTIEHLYQSFINGHFKDSAVEYTAERNQYGYYDFIRLIQLDADLEKTLVR